MILNVSNRVMTVRIAMTYRRNLLGTVITMPTVITLSLTLIEDSRDLSHETISQY
jgi:hypothetical protein